MESLWNLTRQGNVDQLHKLLPGVDVNILSNEGQSLLHLACYNGDFYTARLLIDHGADPNARDRDCGRTPLHYAVDGRDSMICGLLLSRGASLTGDFVTDHDGRTPLSLLHDQGRDELAECLKQNAGGTVFTFGKDEYQLGYTTGDTIGVQPVPRLVMDLKRVVHIAAAKYHTCAVTAQGALFTWGQGSGGRLGHGNEYTVFRPTRVAGLGRRHVVQAACGEYHTLARLSSGKLYSWGSNKHGQLGRNANSSFTRSGGITTVSPTLSPSDPVPATCSPQGGASNQFFHPKLVRFPKDASGTRFVATSSRHCVAITTDGTVYAWGCNNHGELGYKDTAFNRRLQCFPHLVDHLSRMTAFSPAVHAAATDSATCIVREDGKVFQWGHGSFTPSRVRIHRETPRARETAQDGMVVGTRKVRVQKVAAGPQHFAAVSCDGHLYTWGTYAHLLGHSATGADRSTNSSHTAVPKRVQALGAKTIVDVSCSRQHTCAVDDAGVLYTWGEGDLGVLGHEKLQAYQPSPTSVQKIGRVTQVVAADHHTVCLMHESIPEDRFWTSHMTTTTQQTTTPSDSDSSSDEDNDESEVETNDVGSTLREVPSLVFFAEASLAQDVDVFNVVKVLHCAMSLCAENLISYCQAYIEQNLDAIIAVCPGALEALEELCGDMDGHHSAHDHLDGHHNPQGDTEFAGLPRMEQQPCAAADRAEKSVCSLETIELQRRIKQCKRTIKRVNDATVKLLAISSNVKSTGSSSVQLRKMQSDAEKLLAKYTSELKARSPEKTPTKSSRKKRPQKTNRTVKREDDESRGQVERRQSSSCGDTRKVSGGELVLGGESLTTQGESQSEATAQDMTSPKDPVVVVLAEGIQRCTLCNVSTPDSPAMVDHLAGKRHRKVLGRHMQEQMEGAQPCNKGSPWESRTSSSQGGIVVSQVGLPNPTPPMHKSSLRDILKEEEVAAKVNTTSRGAPTRKTSLRDILKEEEQVAARVRGSPLTKTPTTPLASPYTGAVWRGTPKTGPAVIQPTSACVKHTPSPRNGASAMKRFDGMGEFKLQPTAADMSATHVSPKQLSFNSKNESFEGNASKASSSLLLSAFITNSPVENSTNVWSAPSSNNAKRTGEQAALEKTGEAVFPALAYTRHAMRSTSVSDQQQGLVGKEQVSKWGFQRRQTVGSFTCIQSEQMVRRMMHEEEATSGHGFDDEAKEAAASPEAGPVDFWAGMEAREDDDHSNNKSGPPPVLKNGSPISHNKNGRPVNRGKGKRKPNKKVEGANREKTDKENRTKMRGDRKSRNAVCKGQATAPGKQSEVGSTKKKKNVGPSRKKKTNASPQGTCSRRATQGASGRD